MNILKPISDATSPLLNAILSNIFFNAYLDEENKTKSTIGKKYIRYSGRFLYFLFWFFFSIFMYLEHFSKYKYGTWYFPYDSFIVNMLFTGLLGLIQYGIAYLLLNLVNAIVIIILRKFFWGYDENYKRRI